MTTQEKRYCIWCFREIPAEKISPNLTYWCPSCDHGFSTPGLTADEVPFEQGHMMTEPNVKPEWA